MPMFLHLMCWPEARVCLPGDQDLTVKDLVETAKIGIVQHLYCPCAAAIWFPQCFGDLRITTCWELIWLKPGTQNSIIAMQFGNMLVLLSTEVTRALVILECSSLIFSKSGVLRTLWRDAFGHVKLQGRVIGLRFLTDKTHVSTCKMCFSC